MASGDDVQLPDLQVIQRYSLAVRGASAPRADVIAALRADLEWLSSGSEKPAPRPPTARKAGPPKPATKAPAKKSARRA
ncbi:MAG: hypothetical protein LC779_12545 [Actinobacteria bacterium]|nr:hypothetical protein [Actinomycetota bacterium]